MVDTKKADDTEAAPRYAVYDNTYLRFIPGVHDTKKDAETAAKDHHDNVEIREV